MKKMVKTGLFCENNIEKCDHFLVIGLVEGKNCKAVPKNECALQHVVSGDFPNVPRFPNGLMHGITAQVKGGWLANPL